MMLLSALRTTPTPMYPVETRISALDMRTKTSSAIPFYSSATTVRIIPATSLALGGLTCTAMSAPSTIRRCATYARGTRRSLPTSTSSSLKKSWGNTCDVVTTYPARSIRLASRATRYAPSAARDFTTTISCTNTAANDTSAAFSAIGRTRGNRITTAITTRSKSTSGKTTTCVLIANAWRRSLSCSGPM